MIHWKFDTVVESEFLQERGEFAYSKQAQVH